MSDKLGLLNFRKSLQSRYDDFVLWTTSKNHAIPELIAYELGIAVSDVDVFFQLGQLDDDEFDEIDHCKFDMGALFIFVRSPKRIRLQVYAQSKKLLKSERPLEAINNFIAELSSLNLDGEFAKITKGAWQCISKYLKDRGISENVINSPFRGMINKKLTGPRIDWILQAIVYDKEKSLGIFSNGVLKRTYAADYKIFNAILSKLDQFIKNI